MKVEQTARAFAQICKSNGFVQKKKTFYKLCGDGVLQIISAEEKRSPCRTSSTGSSGTPSKTLSISFDLYSIYDHIQAFKLIADSRIPRQFSPYDFYEDADCMADEPRTDYERMMERGFSLLETVTTQEALLDTIEKLSLAHDEVPYYDTDLCGLYLLNGKPKRAWELISGSFTHSWSAFQRTHERLRREDPAAYVKLESAKIDEFTPLVNLWYAILTDNQREIKRYTQENYARNMELLARYDILPCSGE